MIRGKKGVTFPATTIGEVIAVVAMGIIILIFVIGMAGFIAPTIGGFGCGVNTQLKAAVLEHSKFLGGSLLDAPLVMCKQYREPVKIDALKDSACPGLASWCKGATDKEVKSQCIQQCARIQIDRLTDSCWSLGGSGRLDLTGTIWGKLAQATIDVAATVGIFTVSIVIPPAGVALVVAEIGGVAALQTAADITAPRRAQVVRCYRFQVVSPGRLPNGQPFTLEDKTCGYDQYLELTSGTCPKSPCILNGTGVAAVNPSAGENPQMRVEDCFKLKYNMTEPRQVCYIMYYEYEDKDGKLQHSVARSCAFWNEYLPGIDIAFLN
jgi:hypothetical protein